MPSLRMTLVEIITFLSLFLHWGLSYVSSNAFHLCEPFKFIKFKKYNNVYSYQTCCTLWKSWLQQLGMTKSYLSNTNKWGLLNILLVIVLSFALLCLMVFLYLWRSSTIICREHFHQEIKSHISHVKGSDTFFHFYCKSRKSTSTYSTR